ncbi:lipopolysaccharide biosynthesis protein [Shewanella glacialipiscicola]|uniref:lipopolysaccharide biosynthesis protein n=1 Tax=Shewanella glacialipiscicola TaxID=614069 RepID=UPI003D7B004E
MFNLSSFKKTTIKDYIEAIIQKSTYKNSFINLISSYAPLVTGILVFIFFTPSFIKQFGDEDFGIYLIILSVMSYLSLCNFGVPQTLTRLLSKNSSTTKIGSKDSQYITASIILFICVSLIVSLTYSAIVTFFNIQVEFISFLQILIYLITKLLFDVFDSINKSKENYFPGKILIAINLIMSSGFALFLVSKGFGLSGVIYGYTLAMLLSFLMIMMYTYHVVKLRFEFDLSDLNSNMSQMMPSSFWYLAGAIGAIIIFQLDAITIGYVLGPASLVIFGIYFRIADILRQVICSSSDILFTRIAENKMSNNQCYALHYKMIAISILLSAIFSAALFLFGFDLVAYWMGIKEQVDIVLKFGIALYIMLFSINHVSSVFLGALNLHKKPVLVAYIQALINLALTVTLLKTTGNESWAIIASVISLLLTNLWYNIYLFNISVIPEVNNKNKGTI